MRNNLDIKRPVKVELVDSCGDGQRVDNFLFKHLKGVPKSHVYKLLHKGQVRVNGKRIRPSQKLQDGDQVRIPPFYNSDRSVPRVTDYWLNVLAKCILYEDDQLLAVDKPAGIPVHRGSGIEFGVIDILRALRDDMSDCYLVHRLDRDTSGCLLLAKSRSVLLQLQALFRHGSIDKQYLALTDGHWSSSPHTVDAPLLKNILRGGERMVMIDASGKRALSYFNVEHTYTVASLVRVSIKTGRTHQIRVHAQHAGHSVAGDQRYGDRNFNRSMRELGLRRMFLHATRVEFTLRNRVVIECPLPGELSRFLVKLKAGRDDILYS